jgi:hypothetical protein
MIATKTARAWETRHVRAWNVKPGDVLSFFDTKTLKEVRKTVRDVIPSEEYPDYVQISFRKVPWVLHQKRNRSIRVRRLESK